MALHSCRLLTFAFLGWLLVKLTTAELGQHSCFFAGALEPTQGGVEILIFFYSDTRHTNTFISSDTKKPGTEAGTRPTILSVGAAYCKALRPILERFLGYDAAPMKVLGLETSCDETGVAVFDSERGLLAQALHSQIDLHKVYGGVVPEIASRDHIRRLLPLIKNVLRDAGIERPDAVAYTAGPGLVGALMVGSGLANGLGLAWSCPVIRIHHMEGHLLAPMLEEDAPVYPFLALLVSGGHTMLVAVKGLGFYDVLGSTLDDAVGEAFDKTAKLLGLDYPGGPALAALAENGDPQAYAFPRPMLKSPGLDFSFSGLKTAVMLQVKKSAEEDNADRVRADIAASFQCAAIDTLVTRSIQAAQQTNLDRIVVAGGVGANLRLREELAERFGGRVYYPRPEFCTDNGAMIAIAGALRLADGSEPATIHATARWSLETLTPPGSANPA